MNTIVEQIHSEFSLAEDQLMKDLEAQQQAAARLNPDRISRLAELGFNATREVRMLSKEEQDRVSELRHNLANYRMYYPMHKFITEEKVIEICKKYGLIHAPVGCYIDSIPTKNIDDIVEFKLRGVDEVVHFERTDMKWNGTLLVDMTVTHLINTFRYIDRQIVMNSRVTADQRSHGKLLMTAILLELYNKKEFSLDNLLAENVFDNGNAFRTSNKKNMLRDTILLDSGMGTISRLIVEVIQDLRQRVKNKSAFTIVAAKHMLNLDGYTIDFDMRASKPERSIVRPLDIRDFNAKFFENDDPIVLCAVSGGYLIVTAWGDEAQIDGIVNETMN